MDIHSPQAMQEESHRHPLKSKRRIVTRALWVLLGSLGALVALLAGLSGRPAQLQAAGSTTRFVAPAPLGSDAGNDCASRYAPCATVFRALGQANSGDEIRVAAGTYTDPLTITKDIRLLGGYTTTNWVEQDPDAYPTTLDGGGSARVILIQTNADVTISGFHIQKGQADVGAGVYNQGGTLTLAGCYIHDNVDSGSSYGGAGVANAATLFLRGNRIYSNTTSDPDGSGGGVSIRGYAEIEGNEIFSNTANLLGGGMVLWQDANVLLKNNQIYTNASAFGGGLYISLSDIEQTNDTIYGNQAITEGGGVYVYSSTFTLSNTLIVNNAAPNGGGIYSNTTVITPSHTDFFGNSPNQIEDNNGTTIDPTTLDSTNRITDPLFANPAAFDLHLSTGSPARDAGATAPDITTDFEGNGRPFGPAIDRGADEFTIDTSCYARLSTGSVYTDLQQAIDAASAESVVQVAGQCTGVTPSGGVTQTAYVPKSLTLRGGYTVTDWTMPAYGPTLIDAQGGGRALYITGTSVVTVENLALTGGDTEPGGGSGSGGGVYVGPNVTATLQNNVIHGNTANINGGGVYNDGGTVTLQHNTLYDNSAGIGGGVYVAGPTLLANTIVLSNSASTAGGIGADQIGRLTLQHNDFYGNANGDTNANVELDPTDLTIDPALVDPANGDFHLSANSPVIHRADPDTAVVTDFEGHPRPQGPRADIGADEGINYTAVELTDDPTSPLLILDEGEVQGKPVTFTHAITNFSSPGGLTETFDVSITNSDNFTVTLLGITSTVDLAPGEGQTFDVVVSVPSTATKLNNTTTLTATAQSLPSVQDTAQDLILQPGLELTPDYTENADPGEVITLTHTLTNVGGVADTYTVTLDSPLGWTELVTPTMPVALPPGGTTSITARVEVSATAPADLADEAIIVATSSYSPSIAAVVSDTTVANPTVGDRYVAPAGAGGENTNNNCIQQVNPCATIGYAVNQTAWGDTVYVAQGTYTETDIFINQNISLRGGYDASTFNLPGGTVDPTTTIIDAANAGRALRFQLSGTYHPVVEGFTLQNATSSGFGGAVYLQAGSAPTLTHLIIRDTSATNGGGIYIDSGAPTLDNVTIHNTIAADKGGGIYVDTGSPLIQGTTISGTTATSGAGLYQEDGAATIARSRVFSNTADTGGGLYNGSGTLTLQNTFVYSNTSSTSGGGLYQGSGSLNAINNTFYKNEAATNGGGLYDAGSTSLTISNTIVVSNTASVGGGIYDAGGSAPSLDYNNIWGNSAGTDSDSNLPLGPHSISADPLFLDSVSPDLHLSFDSPCVDAADPNTTLTTDIDGDLRPANQGFDIGADELAGCLAENDNTGVRYGVLQTAIDEAGSSHVIKVSGTCRGVNARIVGGRTISQTALITKNLTLQGGYNSQFTNDPGEDPVTTTLDAQGLGRVLVITGPVAVDVNYFQIVGGDATGLGWGPGDDDAGGAIFIGDQLIDLSFSELSISESAATYGGGLYSRSDLSLLNADLYSNTATYGGAIYNQADASTVQQTTIISNVASYGGGVYNGGGSLTTSAVTVTHNSANVSGAGLYNSEGTLSLDRSRVISNTASNDGGGLYNRSTGDLTAVNTFIADNAAEDGGGVYNQSANLALRHNTLYTNTATDQGGGIYHSINSSLPIIDSNLIVNNTAADAGGIYSDGTIQPSFAYNDVWSNTGGNYGGTISDSTGPGNFSDDPQFLSTDPSSSAYLHLAEGSPAEDAGNPNSPVLVDIDGAPRPSNQGFDVGADEIGECFVRVNGDTPTYGSIQYAISQSSDGDELFIAGTCKGVNAFQDGGETVHQTVFLTRSLTLRGGYTLTNWISSEPEVNPTILDALSLGRTLYITGSAEVQVEGLHLRNGSADDGGAIFAGSGVVTLTNNLVYTNTATRGGVLYNDGAQVTVQSTSIYTNTATDGGVFYTNAGESVFDGNTIHNNQATGQGGVLYHAGGTTAFQNNVVHSNTASDGGGVYNVGTDLDVWHNTFHQNTATNQGGALASSAGTPSVVNNIFDGNTAANGSAVYATAGDLDYNDYWPGDAAAQVEGGVGIGAHSLNEDPGYVNAANGDFHLQDASPLMDQGDPSMALLHDFEGHYRPSDQGFDIGADERDGCWARILGNEQIFGNPQRAIDQSSPGDVIQITQGECRGVHPYDDGGTTISQTIHIPHELTLHGGFSRDFGSGGDVGPGTYPDPTATTFDPQGLGRALWVADGISVTLRRLILVDGDAAGLAGGPSDEDAGGGLYFGASSEGVFEHVDVYTSTAALGGAFYNAGQTLSIHNSWLNGNTASQDGGAIYNTTGTLTVTISELLDEGTRFYANSAANRGGGLYNASGTVTVLKNTTDLDPDAVIAFNSAAEGGFAYNDTGTLTLIRNRVLTSTAQRGGAVYNNTGTVVMEANDLSGNHAVNSGGALYNDTGGTLSLDLGDRLHGNTSDGDGGAIFSTGVMTAWNSLIYNNQSVNQGGALYVSGDDHIVHNTFYSNTATAGTSQGGAIYINAGSPLVWNNIFAENGAGTGSAIFQMSGTADLDYNDYSNNTGTPPVDGTVSPGPNRLFVDPEFEDATKGDFHLSETSGLIDQAGDGLGITKDFEGDPRPINEAPDVGADEYDACLVKLLSNNQTYGRIQDALEDAVISDTLRIAEGTCEETITIDQDVIISGSWVKDFSEQTTTDGEIFRSTIIDAQGVGRAITIDGVNSVEIGDVQVKNGFTNGNGGGILSNADNLFVRNVHLNQNQASHGGALAVARGYVEVREGWMEANSASGNGGAIYIASGADVFVSGGNPIALNVADSNGGGIYNDGGTLDVSNKYIEQNYAQGGSGGGIYVANGDLELTNVLLYSNTAQIDGGGLYQAGTGTADLQHLTINDNGATNGTGGGIYNTGGNMTVNASIIAFNSSASGGSGIQGNANVDVSHSLRWQNTYQGSYSETDSINADPRFRDVEGHYLSMHSPAIDAAESTVVEDILGDPRPQMCARDMGIDEYAVLREMEWLTGTPSPSGDTLDPSESITYTYSLQNLSENLTNVEKDLTLGSGTGYTETVTLTLNSSQGWASIVDVSGGNVLSSGPDQALVEVGAGAVLDVIVEVTVPADALATIPGQDSTQEITTLSYEAIQCPDDDSPLTGESGNAITKVSTKRDLVISPDRFGTALPGETITYTHTLTNTGNITDTYTLVPRGGFYASAEIVQPADGQATLPPQESETVVISVTVNAEAAGGLTNVSSAIAWANDDPTLQKAAASNTVISTTTGTRYVSLQGQDSLVDETDGNPDPDAVNYKDNNCTQPGIAACRTLQQAIDQAAAGDTIKVEQGTYTDLYTTTIQGQPITQTAFVNESVTIQGGYDRDNWGESPPSHITQTTVLDPQAQGRALYITDGITVTLDRFQIRNASADGGNGGAIHNQGADLALNALRVYSATATNGGAIYHADGALLIENTLLHGNVATGAGGAIHAALGTLTLQNDTFYANEAANGSAVYIADGSLVVTNTIFANHTVGAALDGNPTSANLAYNLYHGNAGGNTGGLIPAPTDPPDVVGQDPQFVDTGTTPPDLHLGETSPAREAGDPNTEVGTIPLDYENNDRLLGYRVDIGAYEYIAEPSALLEPDQTQLLDPGDTFTYTHTLTNTGNYTDTFQLTASGSQGWSTLMTTDPITLALGESAPVTLTVTVPATGVGGLTDVTVITATSTFGSGAADTVTDTTTARLVPGVDLAANDSASADPGTVVTYTHMVTNTGNGPDTFLIDHHSSEGWTITHPASITVGYGESTPLVISVTVPSNAISGTVDTTAITATSAASATVWAEVQDLTTVNRVYGASLEPDRNQTVDPGDTFSLTHTLTNTGNTTDTFTLDLNSTQGWSDYAPTDPITLASGASTSVVITVTVPSDAGGLVDTTTITATSTISATNQATAVDTTSVRQVLNVSLEQNETSVAPPGSVVTYTHTVTNTGNGPDSFELSASSSKGWTSNVEPTTVSLGAGASAPITVTLNVTGTDGTIDTTTVQATSQSDPGVFDTVVDTTEVRITPGVELAPDQTANGDPGTVVAYTHTVTNTGDGTDTFDLTSSSSEGWPLQLSADSLSLGAGLTDTVVVSVSVPSDALSGTVDTATITATSQLSSTVFDTVADATTVNRVSGVTFAPNGSGITTENTTITYTHTLTNTGNADATFTLVPNSSQGWTVSVDPNPISLSSGASASVDVGVQVPSGAGGLTDVTVVTATQQSDATVWAAVTDTTLVSTGPNLELSPDHSDTASAGTVVTYTHTLTNTWSETDSYELDVSSSQGWPVSIVEPSSPVTLTSGDSATVVISITVPAGTGGLTDTTVVTATSNTDTNVFDTATDVTTVPLVRGVALTANESAAADPGDEVVYNHTLTNTGNADDVFDLIPSSSEGWSVAVSPSSVLLTPGDSAPVVVTVTVLTDALSGTVDLTEVTATSQNDASVNATVQDTTTVNRVSAAQLAPDRVQSTLPDTVITYTHTLTNTGNTTATFALVDTIDPAWTTSLSPAGPVTLASQESVQLQLEVTVPPGTGGLMGVSTITATQQDDPSVEVSVTDTTQVIHQPGAVLGPDNVTNTDPDRVVTHTHTLRNTGNGPDTFDLIATSSRGWLATMEPSSVALDSGQSTSVVVSVTVPAGVGGMTDVTTVTATSQADPSVAPSATDTTNVPFVAGASLQPDRTTTAYTDTVKVYTHTLTNLGNGLDTFTVAASCDQGWSVQVTPSSPSLDAGSSETIEVSLQVPTDAVSGTIATTAITATSQSDPGIEVTVTDATTVTLRPTWIIHLPLVMRAYSYQPPEPGPDLTVNDVTIDPPTPTVGEPVSVCVTVENVGNEPVPFGNNFYVDFYVDRAPQPLVAGDLVWGAQGVWFTIGASRVFCDTYGGFASGSHEIYAQVDTDNTVDEMWENNNHWGPEVLGITGTGGPVPTPSSSEQDGPRPTPTPMSRGE